MSKVLSYRPDIDTLRAVAVLSVVIFHIEKNWLPGGFLGVDIFFVISGFLITMIIHREMSSGIFSFKKFYIRRIKRILPAFFTVLTVTLICGFLLFTKDDFFLLWRTALSTLGFISNIFFAKGQGYFDPIQEEKPLLHIWSLSVEEQYYFVFPILLLLVVRKSWRTQFAFLITLCVFSILASFMPTALDKYYLSHLRACEMLIGSLTAVWMQYRQQQGLDTGKQYAAVGALLSVCVLFACLFTYTEKTAYFPGPAAMIPCLAAAAFIYFNQFEHRLKKFFQWKITVGIGLIYFVEKPFKNWKGSFAQSVTWVYAVPMLVLAITPFLAMKLPFMEQYDRMGLARSYTSCHNNTDKQCIWGDTDKQPELLILGDSHADQYKTFFDTVGKKENWSAAMVSADSCAYVEDYAAPVFKQNASCRAVYEYAKEHLPQYSKVLLAMRWGSQMPENSHSLAYDADFFKKFDLMLQKLSSEKQAVYLMIDNPNLSYNGLRAYILSYRIPGFSQNLAIDETVTSKGNERIKELAEKYANVHIIDATSYIPENFKINGLPVYSDRDHINPYGGRELAKRFSEKHTLLQ